MPGTSIHSASQNLEAFVASLRQHFGARLERVILFGSRARGESEPDSDYDLLVIVNEADPQDEPKIGELEDNALYEWALVFSTHLVTQQALQERKYEPFLINAQREGVLL